MITKILVVDDTPAMLLNLQEILADAGYRVNTAQNGKEALEKARRDKPDLVFMDILMPDMDGYEACRELHKDATTKNIPVIFVTTKNQKADKLWAQMQGGKGFITKPYTPDQIIDQIKALDKAG